MLNYFLSLLFLFASLSSCTLSSEAKNNLREIPLFNAVEAVMHTESSALDTLQQPKLKSVKHSFKDSKSIKLISWNIRHLGRTKSAEELQYIASVLRDFDIVAIQEVVAIDPAGAQAVAKIADELNRMGANWDYQISDPTKSPSSNISERYAFLWKTSKVNIVHRAYLDRELEDLFFREPFLAQFKVKGNAQPFYVVNYHSRKYTDKPEEEIIHFIDYPARLNSSNIIVAGDFNLDENHDVWRPLYHKGFNNSLYKKATTLKMKCANGNYLNHSIDNIYYLPGIEKIHAASIDFVQGCEFLELARGISDHLPVYMEFHIKGN